MAEPTAGFSLNVLTINTHKGFTAFNRRFILPELRDAVRSVSADIVCLQEVMGAHEVHPLHIENWPDTTHYEFLADTMWSDYATGAMRFIRKATTATPCCRAFPLNTTKIAISRSATGEARPAVLPHRAAAERDNYSRDLRPSRSTRRPTAGAVDHAGGVGQYPARGRAGGGGWRF